MTIMSFYEKTFYMMTRNAKVMFPPKVTNYFSSQLNKISYTRFKSIYIINCIEHNLFGGQWFAQVSKKSKRTFWWKNK